MAAVKAGKDRPGALPRRRPGYVLVMRHSPEDHLVEQILGLGKGLVAGLTLALSVRQVGEIDDETAFFGRDQIDRPCRRTGYLFHTSLLSQVVDHQDELPQDAVQQTGLQLVAAVGTRVTRSPRSTRVWPPLRRPGTTLISRRRRSLRNQFISRYPDRSTDLRINRRPETSH